MSEENGRLALAEAELAELRQRIDFETWHDPLTGLPNRAGLIRHLDREVAVGSPTVLMVSIDSFRAVNDSLGSQIADRVLIDVGSRLRELAGSADLVARLRGNEFAIVALDGDRATAHELGERVAAVLHRPSGHRGIWLSVSIGICLPHADATPTTYLRDADTAMHAAKNRGAGLTVVFEPAMRTTVVDRFETTAALADALESGTGLLLHYQPVFELERSTVVGAEALVRWQHPIRGMVPPDEFIGLAEQSGLIADLGRWVIKTATDQLCRWREQARDGEFRVHVNLSPVEFRHPGLVEYVADVVGGSGIDPADLLLEITETGLMTADDDSVDQLHKLRELGVGLGIDDFGTGYSSIGYLGRLPVDTVKLDRSLITEIGSSPYAYGLAGAIVELLDSARMRIIAEGIETEVQVAHLRALACHYGQGFHLGRPAPAEAMSTHLDARSS